MDSIKEKGDSTELQKCLEKIDELHQLIKSKDNQIEELKEHQLFLETEAQLKTKKRRVNWGDSGSVENDSSENDKNIIKNLIETNDILNKKIQTLEKRLGINKSKHIPTSPTKTQETAGFSGETSTNDSELSAKNEGSEQLAKLIEDKMNAGFNIIQENMNKLIDEKFKSFKETRFVGIRNSNPGSYSAVVGENENAQTVDLRNIMAATRNEELTEQAAQKRRANNLIIHGRQEFSSSEDNTYIKQTPIFLFEKTCIIRAYIMILVQPVDSYYSKLLVARDRTIFTIKPYVARTTTIFAKNSFPTFLIKFIRKWLPNIVFCHWLSPNKNSCTYHSRL